MSPEYSLYNLYLDYCIRKTNEHIGSGLGGNIRYFGFLASKNNLFSKEVESLEISDTTIIWNPEFILSFGKNKKHIRLMVDKKISESIGNFDYFISDNNGFVINKDLFPQSDDKTDPADLTLNQQVALSLKESAKFASILDSLSDYSELGIHSKTFSEILTKIKLPAVILGIRICISIDRLVKFNLDEDRYLGPIFREISKRIS